MILQSILEKFFLIPPFLDSFGHSIDSLLATVNVTKEKMPLVISTALSTVKVLKVLGLNVTFFFFLYTWS